MVSLEEEARTYINIRLEELPSEFSEDLFRDELMRAYATGFCYQHKLLPDATVCLPISTRYAYAKSRVLLVDSLRSYALEIAGYQAFLDGARDRKSITSALDNTRAIY